jgi:CheY-like chemotaxis protein
MANRVAPSRKTLKKILIVDDDSQIRTLLKEILRGRRYAVVEAQDGRQALDIVHRESIDLIITDRSMPNMDGLELLKQLREENRQIPTLIISAYGEESLWAEAIALGAEDYILKPFSSESVLKVVKRKLG